MRVLLVGAGGVGGAFAAIAARRDFYETIVIADYDEVRADKAAAVDPRFTGARVDASDAARDGRDTALVQVFGRGHGSQAPTLCMTCLMRV